MSFTVTINATEALAGIENLRRSFQDAVSKVEPTFGAFMPYSLYAERGNGRYPPQPAIEPAISRNSQWITSQFADRLMPALDRAVRGGGVASLKAEVQQIWEDVLNDRPRAEAAAMARYRTGAHSGSIRGYATPQGVEKALQDGERLAATQRMQNRSG